jgi:fibronectin type 3 domain-containing protein
MHIDSSGALVGLKDYQPLPVPTVPGFICGNKSVLLSWSQQIVGSDYTSWYVEKSADNGNTYTKTTGLPVTNISQKDNKASTTWLTDSLKDNTTTYLYRLRGVTPFGETGPPSLPVKVKGKELLEYVPHIRRNEVDEKGELTMTWEFEQEGNDKIKGFALNQAEKEAGPYKVVMENIPANSRVLKYDKLFPTNYFTITAVAKEGKSSLSFPVLVQPVDSTPPAAPVGVQAVIDSSGKVIISWEKNKETDMLGYKVFRTHVAGQEMSVLTDTVIFANSFRDSVNIKSLNSKVYYTVTAFDKRYNQSAFSQIITVKKPDVIPPSSPVFTEYKIVDNSVKLTWIPSGDEDVAAHILYRRNMADSSTRWQELKVLGIKTDHYQDIAVEPGLSYSYIIIAKDSSGLESTTVKPLLISIPPKPEAIKVKSLNATVYRDKYYLEIFWKDNLDVTAVQAYQLYKAPVGTPLSLWKVMKAGSRQSIDEQLVINTEYQYGIRVVMKDGTIGQLTTIQVTY